MAGTFRFVNKRKSGGRPDSASPSRSPARFRDFIYARLAAGCLLQNSRPCAIRAEVSGHPFRSSNGRNKHRRGLGMSLLASALRYVRAVRYPATDCQEDSRGESREVSVHNCGAGPAGRNGLSCPGRRGATFHTRGANGVQSAPSQAPATAPAPSSLPDSASGRRPSRKAFRGLGAPPIRGDVEHGQRCDRTPE